MEPASLSGSVTAEGDAVAGVQVELAGQTLRSATTDDAGRYSFESVSPGSHELTISGWPEEVTFATTRQSVTLSGGQSATVDFPGSYVRTATLDGVVQVDDEGLSGATVRAEGPEEKETTTSSDGSFRIDDLRAGEYVVTVTDVDPDVRLDQSEKSVSVDVGGQESLTFTGFREKAAEVSIRNVEKPGSSLRFNLDAVRGEADVVVEVDPGTETVTGVRLFLGGERVAARSFGELTGPETVEMRVNTAEFDPDTGEPSFPNGRWTLEAVVDTEAATDAADTTLEIGLDNRDRIAGISTSGVGDGVVNRGRRWFGGRDLSVEVVPVIYSLDRAIGAVSLRAEGDPSANGGPALDLGSGHGQAHKEEGAPFVFTATVADNGGDVEDDPDGDGHTIRVVRVFDESGVDITSEFVPGRVQNLQGFYVDFLGPVVSGGAVQVGGSDIGGGEHFSRGEFGASNVTERGVGGLQVTLEVDDADEADPIAGVTSIADLGERSSSKYSARVVEIVDLLGNETPSGDFPSPSPPFGVDRTPLDVSGLLPSGHLVLNPDDDAGDGAGDNDLRFIATDPTLADGNVGSGYGSTTVTARDQFGGEFDLSGSVSPGAEGTNTIEVGGLLEREWTVNAVSEDQATPPLQTGFSYSFVLDRTDPDARVTDPPPSSVSVSSSSVTLTVEASVTDANGLSEVILTVRDADGGTADVCEASDPLIPVGTGAGEVNRNDVDVTDGASSIDELLTFQNAGAGTEQDVCFFIDAADAAEDRGGEPEPNRNQTSTRTVISWQ